METKKLRESLRQKALLQVLLLNTKSNRIFLAQKGYGQILQKLLPKCGDRLIRTFLINGGLIRHSAILQTGWVWTRTT